MFIALSIGVAKQDSNFLQPWLIRCRTVKISYAMHTNANVATYTFPKRQLIHSPKAYSLAILYIVSV